MSQWLWPLLASAKFCYPREGEEQLWRPVWATGPAVVTPLEATQSPFWFLATALFVSPPEEHITIILAHTAMFFGNLSARKESAKGWWLMGTLIRLRMPLLHCFFLIAFCMWNYMSAVFCHLDRSTSILRAMCSSGVEIPTAIDCNWWFWACERFLNSDCSVNSPSEDVHCWEQCPVLLTDFYSLPVPSHGERNGAPYVIQLVSKEVHSSRWNQ